MITENVTAVKSKAKGDGPRGVLGPCRLFIAPNAIFDPALEKEPFCLTPIDRLVYLYLCRRRGNEDTAFPSYNTIARDVGISRRKAISSVATLIRCGLLACERRYGTNGDHTSNLYTIIDVGEVLDALREGRIEVVYRDHDTTARAATTGAAAGVGGAPDTTNAPVVHGVHHPSAPGAPPPSAHRAPPPTPSDEAAKANPSAYQGPALGAEGFTILPKDKHLRLVICVARRATPGKGNPTPLSAGDPDNPVGPTDGCRLSATSEDDDDGEEDPLEPQEPAPIITDGNGNDNCRGQRKPREHRYKRTPVKQWNAGDLYAYLLDRSRELEKTLATPAVAMRGHIKLLLDKAGRLFMDQAPAAVKALIDECLGRPGVMGTGYMLREAELFWRHWNGQEDNEHDMITPETW